MRSKRSSSAVSMCTDTTKSFASRTQVRCEATAAMAGSPLVHAASRSRSSMDSSDMKWLLPLPKLPWMKRPMSARRSCACRILSKMMGSSLATVGVKT
jgi:hypothetical protein